MKDINIFEILRPSMITCLWCNFTFNLTLEELHKRGWNMGVDHTIRCECTCMQIGRLSATNPYIMSIFSLIGDVREYVLVRPPVTVDRIATTGVTMYLNLEGLYKRKAALKI